MWWRKVGTEFFSTAGLDLVAVLCGGVIICYAGIWRIWSLLEQLVIFQHALMNDREEHNSTSDSINEAGRLMWFKARSLTVRFWMPSENAPICLTVPSESSIWRNKNQLSEEPTKTKRCVKDWAQHLNPTNETAHLFKPVKVILVDLELKAFLKASTLWHLHIHWTNVLLTLILLLLPQTAKVTKWQFSRLVHTDRRQKSCLAFYNCLLANADSSWCFWYTSPSIKHYLNLGGSSKQRVVWVFETLLFVLLGLWANQQGEMGGEVATQ